MSRLVEDINFCLNEIGGAAGADGVMVEKGKHMPLVVSESSKAVFIIKLTQKNDLRVLDKSANIDL